ncbi:MAG: rhamnulokinase [Ruminococcaceae bacterium]|nr:rhamnulokinase [Oscillospiraceae bacterium]
MRYSLAVDIGASSGRHILGWLEGGILKQQEVYRFENNITNQNGTLVWDIEHLVAEVKAGLKACGALGKIPCTVAIDTWGVDYVLLDKNKKEIMPVISYRDSRTNGIPEEIDKIIPREELYKRTGIQPINFNTIYQLYCDKKSGKLDKAAHFLMIPEYLSFKLTGVIKNEYTNATTGSIVNAKTKTLDKDLLKLLGIKTDIFKELSLPTTVVGNLSDEVREEVGFDTTVIFCPSHDTASAVAACPVGDNGVYISSGTWSLIGTENKEPILNAEAMNGGFTNEGGINYRYRFLENIMGMWLFQNIRCNLDKKYSYDEMMNMAMESDFKELINPNSPEFTAPENMIEAIRKYLDKPDLPIGDVLNSVYNSLANSYNEAVKTIERVSGKQIDLINIIGGGSKDSYLNKLTKEYTGKKVLAGPTEATAIGNLIAQFMYLDNDFTLEKARETVKKSFSIVEV